MDHYQWTLTIQLNTIKKNLKRFLNTIKKQIKIDEKPQQGS